MIELTLVYLDSCDVMQIVLFVNVLSPIIVQLLEAQHSSSTFSYATDTDVFIYDLLQTLCSQSSVLGVKLYLLLIKTLV